MARRKNRHYNTVYKTFGIKFNGITMKINTLLLTTILLLTNVILIAQNSDTLAVTGPGTYKILIDEKDPIRIPFKMHNGKPLMELEINGKKSTMMIDNGVLWDEIWLFGSPLVEELQLKPLDTATIGGSGEGDPTQAYFSKNLTLKFDDIIFHEQPVLVSPPAAGFYGMFPGADGQLCNTFFRHFIVEFDFINNEVILHSPEQFNYSGSGCTLDMTSDEVGRYSVPFALETLDGKVYNDRVDIDFGGSSPLKIALNTKHAISLPSEAKKTNNSSGAQGKISEYKGKIKSMTIGDYTFDNLTVKFEDEETNNLGVIGLPLFMKFNIIFDYFNNKIYLKPNDNFNKSFK